MRSTRSTGASFATARSAGRRDSTRDSFVSAVDSLSGVCGGGRATGDSACGADARSTSYSVFSHAGRSTAWTLEQGSRGGSCFGMGVPLEDHPSRDGEESEDDGSSKPDAWWAEDDDAHAKMMHVRDSDGRGGAGMRWVRQEAQWVTAAAEATAAAASRRTSACSLFTVRGGPSRRGTDASLWELQWPPARVTRWLEEGPPNWEAEDAAVAAVATRAGGGWAQQESLRRRKEVIDDAAALGSLRRRMEAVEDAVAVA